MCPLILRYADRRQEYFLCISINGGNEVITIGLFDRAHVHPREVFADPITDRASAVIIARNRTTGSLEPSGEDRGTLKPAGETLEISLLGCIIFNRKGYYSFLEHGEMEAL